MADAINCELLADREFEAGGLGANVDEVAIIQEKAIDFAVTGKVEGFDGAFFMDEFSIFGARLFDLAALFGGERDQFVDAVIGHAHSGGRGDLHLISDGGQLRDKWRQWRREIDLDRFVGGLNHQAVNVSARGEVVADD